MHLMSMKGFLNIKAGLIGACCVCLMMSCLKNDFPYAVVKLAITAFEVEGQKEGTLIDAENRTVTVRLEESVNLKKVKVAKFDVSDEGSSPVGVGSVIDLSTPLAVTLHLYQDYVWTIIAQQEIERYFTVEGQLGAARFNEESKEAYVNVPLDKGLEHLKLTSLKLTAAGGSMDGTQELPVLAWTAFDNYATAKVTVTCHEVQEEWTLFALLVDMKASMQSVDAWTNVAWLKGAGIDGNKNGFEYKEAGALEWIRVDEKAVSHDGGSFSTRLTHLKPETNYVCRSYSGEEFSAEVAFTTEGKPEVPNLGFEDWHQEGKVIQPWAEGGTSYWDTGNDGATTLGEKYNITESTTDVWPGAAFGSKAAKLNSKYIVVKFAAGNLFVGEYKRTDGTNGVLGLGRPYTARPTRLKGHFKYTSMPISSTDTQHAHMKNKPDTCIVWIALGDWNEPVEIRTNPSNPKYFDKNDPHVIAYGEMTCGKTVSEYQDFSIELDYRSTSRKPKYLLIVCSASKYGDFFTGGKGSEMWVDDFSLEYDYSD